MRHGQIEFVEIQAQMGGECRVRNPWGTAGVTIFRNGRKAERSGEALLKIAARKGENVVVVPVGTQPQQWKRTVPGQTSSN
jgi:hypothetical protein